MPTEEEIRENLVDAGCSEIEVRSILGCICSGNLTDARKQLDRIHKSQQYIDRLDYLIYRIRD